MGGKNNSFNEKDIIKKIFDDRWVRFAFGSQGKINTRGLNLGITEFSEDKVSQTHSHDVDEALFILSGSGDIRIAGEVLKVKENDFLHVPKGTDHTIITGQSRLKIFFVFSGETIIDH